MGTAHTIMTLLDPLRSTQRLLLVATLLRLGMLLYGLFQDAHSPVKYTDIDYQVFTDAAALVARGQSPYSRETYRYTPLLAWLLLPCGWAATTTTTTSWLPRVGTSLLAAQGKLLFAGADILTGLLMLRMLLGPVGAATTVDHPHRARRLVAALWLLNPMVATISTRGSSEGLLALMVVALLGAVQAGRVGQAGALLGLAVHFKIYPFVYGASVVWWLGRRRGGAAGAGASVHGTTVWAKVTTFATRERLRFVLSSLASFTVLNLLMYSIYGHDFLQHTFLHHVTRIDHRHNFSPYNIALYSSSARHHPGRSVDENPLRPMQPDPWHHRLLHPRLESVAFAPQLLLSVVLIPVVLAKRDLPSTMLAQTFAFVTFNKVCTSQYFIWYLCLLPFYLPRSTLSAHPAKGVTAACLWVLTQAAWLYQAYQLEFLGRSTFVPGLWASSLAFFVVNCWILGVIIRDVGSPGRLAQRVGSKDTVATSKSI